MRWHTLIGLLLILPLTGYAKEEGRGVITSTPVIGTAEHPTIDGGFFIPPAKNNTLTMRSVIDEKRDKSDKINQKSDLAFAVSNLPDEFSSDKNIKPLLTAAASNHKLAYVLQGAKRLNLPVTVALIPMVESQYQTNAISYKGATGAWQFMPKTAKEYGLTSQTSRLFATSTDAALRLLKNLHQQFHHWTLAFAAYNAGSGRVMAALRHSPEAACIEDLDLPVETKQYVHRLKAIQRAIARLSLQT